ncbi:hypothetical protein vBEfaHEF1TV_52 [Enterococcus phage vB_EfaH_EF1TV]|nr:hypothetical protein vBEfaHEF1TV_52 [Enterococcus phage vB_EfaH_EF1TV]
MFYKIIELMAELTKEIKEIKDTLGCSMPIAEDRKVTRIAYLSEQLDDLNSLLLDIPVNYHETWLLDEPLTQDTSYEFNIEIMELPYDIIEVDVECFYKGVSSTISLRLEEVNTLPDVVDELQERTFHNFHGLSREEAINKWSL